jgi:TolA-binding protein
MTSEERFGKLLDDALGDIPPDTALRVQRANVLAALRRDRRPLARLRWELAFGATLVLGVALIVSLVVRLDRATPPTTATWRGGVELPPAASATAGDRPEAIDFSDGSRVLLEPNASASVVRLDPAQTELTLKQGRLAASVKHRDGATFSVTAGPYRVRVVGTKFTVAWEPLGKSLRVAVTEGRIQLSGGDLGPRLVELGAGEQMERRPAEPAAEQREQSPALGSTVAQSQEEPPARQAPHIAKPPLPPSIGELSQAGKYRDAVALAEQRGFERVTAELPEGELLALGNAARYVGSASRARAAMLALRSRFAGRHAAQLGALYLAKIAEQLEGNPKEAARWLRVFLSESPTGSFAADARASLLSILLSSGDTVGATAVAREYLRYHPNGPIAGRARELVLRSDEGK